MNKKEILQHIVNALEIDDYDLNSNLNNIEEYDSMGILIIIEVFELEGIDIFPDDFRGLDTLESLVEMINRKYA